MREKLFSKWFSIDKLNPIDVKQMLVDDKLSNEEWTKIHSDYVDYTTQSVQPLPSRL